MMLHQQLLQQQKMNEKILDHKLLLENLSSLPQDILQNLIRTGQLQLSMDEGKYLLNHLFYNQMFKKFSI